MGWSCATVAAETMQRLTDACIKQTGTQNVYVSRGVEYFWEPSRNEYDDGAITGGVYTMSGRRVGSFRITGDGVLESGPGHLKALLKDR